MQSTIDDQQFPSPPVNHPIRHTSLPVKLPLPSMAENRSGPSVYLQRPR